MGALTVYLFCGTIVLLLLLIFCLCEPCMERYCYKNNRKVMPITG